MSKLGRPRSGANDRDGYKLLGTKGQGDKNVPGLFCQHCKKTTVLKSNQGIHEELERISAFLRDIQDVACRTEGCPNKGVGVTAQPELYSPNGKTAAKAPRWRCKACRKSVTRSSPIARQRKSHKNIGIFKDLVSGMSLRMICEREEISYPTLYDKIAFLQRQCRAFAAERERRMPAELTVPRLHLCADRQDYMVNWPNRSRRRHVQFTSVATADMQSGYVFATTLNYDPAFDHEEMEQLAQEAGDPALPPPFRRYARFWMQEDYQRAVTQAMARAAAGEATEEPQDVDDIRRARQDLSPVRDDLEGAEAISNELDLPGKGCQVHWDYTAYGHFLYLRHLLRSVGKVRFYLDEDAGMLAGCMATWMDRIRDAEADVFQVMAAKNWTIDQKETAVRRASRALEAAMAANPGLTEKEVKLLVMRQRLSHARAASRDGRLNGIRIDHPFPNMSEPEKQVTYRTDRGDLGLDRLAALFDRASLHAVDTVFQQIRRRMRLFERAIPTARRNGAMWHGYAPYDPARLQQLLDIYRTWHNWVFIGEDGRTAAMRLGIAKGPIRYQDIVYFQPTHRSAVLERDDRKPELEDA